MAVQVVVDDVDLTSITQEGSVTHQHQMCSFATVKFPAEVAPTDEPSRLKIYLPGSDLDFHGSLVSIEDEGEEDEMFSTFTFADPTAIFPFRPARDADGDFSRPSFLETFVTGPAIMNALVSHSVFAGDGTPADCEGPMGLEVGTIAAGGANLSGAPTDWPMSIEEIKQLLVDTGELDVVNEPIDSNGNMGRLHFYNGDFGSVTPTTFRYATGTSSNCVKGRRSVDLSELMNKLWIYLGPRVKTPTDPAGDQHWRANITGSDGGLPNPPQNVIAAAVEASRAAYFQRMVIRIFDAQGDENPAAQRWLYRRWWQTETWLRCRPKTMVALTPEPGIVPDFRTGDFINVEIGPRFRGGAAGQQRVMEYTYRFSDLGNLELGEPILQTGAPAVLATSMNEGA